MICAKCIHEVRVSAGYADVLCPSCREIYQSSGSRRSELVKTVGDKQVWQINMPDHSVFHVIKDGRVILTG